MITLYDYYRSSSAYRVRIALALKGLPYDIVHVDLLAGDQNSERYREVNPQGFVPVLADGNVRLAQSLAIIEYLDETHPEILLICGDARQKSYIRSLSYIVACEIAPLNIPKVWKGYMDKSADEAKDWMAHWIHEGFAAYEELLSGDTKFSCGDMPSMADACLIPQIYNARRFNVALDKYPKICAVEQECLALEAFQKASPESHPNAPDDLGAIHGPMSPVLVEVA